MVVFRPYTAQTQASSISQQNSGGDGYIGNQGLQEVGQALGNAIEVGFGVDNETIRKQQAQEVNRNKFEAEIERREQEQYIQSQRLSGMAQLADLDIEIGSEAENLKSKIGNGGQNYAKSLQEILDKKIGTIQKNLSFEQKQFLEPRLLEFKSRHLSNAMQWERTERINNDIDNVEKYQKSLYAKINDNIESVNEAKTQMSMLVDNLVVEPSVKRKILDDFDETITQLHYNYRIQTNPESFLNDFKKVGGNSFEETINYILDIEGGYVAKDGRSNAPANFGINQKANPDIDVKNLSKEQAKQIYKERYWDKINADSLPQNIRLIAMDSAVNQGVGIANKLINESNGDPVKFTELKIKYYKSLNQPENEKTWIKRAQKVLKASQETNVGVVERQYAGKAQQIIEKNEQANIKFAINNGDLNYKDIADNPDISDADKLIYMTAQKKYDTNIAKAEAQAAKKQKEQYNNFVEKIKREIDESFWSIEKLNAIRDNLQASDYDAMKKRIEQHDEEINLPKYLITEPIGSNLHTKAVNNEFNKERQNIFNLSNPVQERIQNAVNFLDKVGGIVPSEFKSIMQNMAIKPNSENVDFINGVYQNAKLSQNKAVLNNLPDDVALMSNIYQSYLDTGNSSQQALSLLNEDLNITPQKRKERGDIANDIIRKATKDGKSFIETYGDTNAFLFGLFGNDYSNITTDSDVYSDLEADAKEQFTTAFMKTGNEKQSLEMAFDYIEKTYSKFNGEYMKYAPDVVTGFDIDIVQQHFNENVIKNKDILSLSERLEFDIDNIKLAINKNTEKAFKTRIIGKDGVSFKTQLEYNIIVDNLPLRDNKGNVIIYIPDIEELKQIHKNEMKKEPIPLTLPRG